MLHSYYKYYVSFSISILWMHCCLFYVVFMLTSLKSTHSKECLVSCINYAFRASMLHSYYNYYVSSSVSILLMQFQNNCHFQVVFKPTSLKSTQCNVCLAVCVNYAFCVNMSIPLMQFQKMSFSVGFHANYLEINPHGSQDLYLCL